MLPRQPRFGFTFGFEDGLRRIWRPCWMAVKLEVKFWLQIDIQQVNYVKCDYFCDYYGIDNVTVRIWKFSDFSSGQTVGTAGDGILYHILVLENAVENIIPKA